MDQPIRIIGSFLSPYVRKVLVALELKGLQYEVDSITPFYGNDEFTRLSPLRRIPVLIDDRVTLCDSTRWPRTAAFYERVMTLPPFSRLKHFEDQLIGVPFAERRARLLAAGAPLTATTLAEPTPRRSILLPRSH